MSNIFIAQVCHAVNRAYCIALGDTSQPLWENAPDWQRDSAIKGVEFHISNPRATAAASHISWLEQKLKDGWKYGPVKNPETKEHPCCIPFEELPKEQQAKDFIFREIVHSLSGVDNV